MSRNYDNWERLVAAVLKKEQLWQMFHSKSRSPSISSESSGFSLSLGLSSSIDDMPFSSSNPVSSVTDRKGDDNDGNGTAAVATPSRAIDKDQPPVETPARKRDLRIQVPKPQIQYYGVNSPKMATPIQSVKVHPRDVVVHSESRTNNRPDDAKQQSYPLPLPPEAISSSSPLPRPNSASSSPKVPSNSPEGAKGHKSPAGTSWKRGKLLGEGAFGNVYLGFNSEKGKMCAMKEFNLYSDGAKSLQSATLFGKEIALLSRLKHPNIVPYYGSEMVGDNLYIYYEYVSGGSIYMILQQYGKLGETAIRIYTQQILSGLAYLHSKGITHRDIRGHTILVDPTGVVKLSNFGIEKQIAGQTRPSLLMDSPYWMAPEVIMNPNTRNTAIDIWSLGCTVIEMATSKPPLSQYDRGVSLFNNRKHRELPTIPDHLSDEGKDFLRRCLQWDPLHRATASQLLEHPFVKSSSPVILPSFKLELPFVKSSSPVILPSPKLDLLSKRTRVPTFSGHPAPSIATPSEVTDHVKGHLKGKPQGDIFTPRNISNPVSPVGSPLPHPRSPLIGQNGVIQYPHLKRSLLPPETIRNLPKHTPGVNSPSYWDPNILRKVYSGDNDDSHHRKQLAFTATRKVRNK
ncbi:hypothetical protein CASFOL_003218 [Castilleja foliolosa]|uniref:mitogen-activated protein kinase kinase kinase n=1 Tax=Castilleja foliolosa TaxID=1961234 RepID=A0ABD3EGI5_9LAMI